MVSMKMSLFVTIVISQGSVPTRWRCGGSVITVMLQIYCWIRQWKHRLKFPKVADKSTRVPLWLSVYDGSPSVLAVLCVWFGILCLIVIVSLLNCGVWCVWDWKDSICFVCCRLWCIYYTASQTRRFSSGVLWRCCGSLWRWCCRWSDVCVLL